MLILVDNEQLFAPETDYQILNVPAALYRTMSLKRVFFSAYMPVNDDARYNPELRRHFLPIRLWRNLPEMHPRCSGFECHSSHISNLEVLSSASSDMSS